MTKAIKFKKIFVIILALSFFSTTTYFINKGIAQTPPPPTVIENVAYRGVDSAYSQIDITKTSTAFSTSMILEPASFVTTGGSSTDSMQKAGECITAAQATGSFDGCTLGQGAYAPNNSLMGAATSLAKITTPDAIPLNLALYFREQVKNVPVVGAKVYAQGEGRYNNLFGANFAFLLWKAFRNMAYGLMSIFLIIIGIFIMVRKKSDPKTVLTLQAALPKIVISLVLITFSFAIGATMTNFMFPLRKISDSVFTSVTRDIFDEQFGAGANTGGILSMTGGIVSALGVGALIAALAGPGAIAGVIAVGVIGAVLASLIALVLLIVTIMVYIKTLIIYVKMLGDTIMSPLVFAWGAIPGNDAAIINWFKKMAAKLISVTAMYFLLKLSFFLPQYMLMSGLFGDNITAFSGGVVAEIFKGPLQALLLLMITPFASIMLCVQALGVPKKVDGWILGPPKR